MVQSLPSYEGQNTINTTEERLLTMKEAMSYLRVSRSTLYRLMWSGQITGYKVGSTWRFHRKDLQGSVQAAKPPVPTEKKLQEAVLL